MAQQFEQPLETSDQLRAQRMTAKESRAVIDLWQQEQTEQTSLTDKPAVPDVAEGLEITVEDVQRLLQTVRARREDEVRLLAQEQAELRRHQKPRQLVARSQWIEVKPGIWEDAGLPGYSYIDFNQLSPNPQEASKHVQPLAIRFAAALAKVILLSLTVGLIIAPLFYVLWCVFTVPHRG